MAMRLDQAILDHLGSSWIILDQASHLKFVEFVLPLFRLVLLKFYQKSYKICFTAYLTSQMIQKRRGKKITQGMSMLTDSMGLHQLGPLGRVGLVVDMCVCFFLCLFLSLFVSLFL